jgi:RecB family exonuclease
MRWNMRGIRLMHDNSQLQAFKDCPEKYRLKYIEQLKKIEEGKDEHDKNFGKAIHAGLEAYYKGRGLEACISEFKANYPNQLSDEDLSKTQENGAILLEAYDKHYQVEDKKWTI